MTHILWLTDLHLNFLSAAQIEAHLDQIVGENPDMVLIGGDISEAHRLIDDLEHLADRLQKPLYFVLGNHDFYHGSISAVRGDVEGVCQRVAHLHWLPAETVIEISPTTALIGHDGWADLQYGNFATSSVWMNDYVLIQELAGRKKVTLLPEMTALAAQAAQHIQRVLALTTGYQQIIVLTHVPPFKEACWHEGAISNDEWLPHFTCKAVGEVLRDWMADHPDQQMLVLCGHTHGDGEAQILPNLKVITGGAEYGIPKIQRMFEF